jgi:hypothetical protein
MGRLGRLRSEVAGELEKMEIICDTPGNVEERARL